MLNPLISVIVPAFNAAPFVTEAVTSALNQTLTNIEVLVRDDASNDETWPILCQFSGDSRLELARNDTNLGFNGNMQLLITSARGEWLCLTAADDVLDHDCLERSLEAARRYGAQIVFHEPRKIDASSNKIASSEARFRREHLGDLQTLLQFGHYPKVNGMLIRRDVALSGVLDPRMRRASDLDYVRSCLSNSGAQFVYMPEALSSWRRHPGSQSVEHVLECERDALCSEIFDFERFPKFASEIAVRILRINLRLILRYGQISRLTLLSLLVSLGHLAKVLPRSLALKLLGSATDSSTYL